MLNKGDAQKKCNLRKSAEWGLFLTKGWAFKKKERRARWSPPRNPGEKEKLCAVG